MQPNERFPIQVRTLTGLEQSLAVELSQMGASNVEAKSRVVLCQGNLELLYRANMWCRTAIRVLRPLASFPAPDEQAFYKGVQAIDWSQWMKPTGTLAVDVHIHSAFTTHSLFIAQLTKDAIVDAFRDKTGERPSVDLDNPQLRIAVTMFRGHAQIYTDASGESLHRRGYRRKAGEAPLNETLAAGILKLAEWKDSIPLVDPMCGSGTFLIEAAMMAKNIAPGLLRKRYGFQLWADYDRALYERLVDEAKQSVRSEVAVSLRGMDLDPQVIAIARENAERAGVADVIHFEVGDFLSWEPKLSQPGIVVVNPPYDERLAVGNIAHLFERMGDRLRDRFGGWTAYLLSGNLEAIRYLGLHSGGHVDLLNGSIECQLHQFPLTADVAPSQPIDADTRVRYDDLQTNPKWKQRAETFANRLKKNQRHYSKWAKREGVTCWRIYDWDIPELPFLIDVFDDRLHFAEVPRNIEHSEIEHRAYMELMVRTASEVLAVPSDKIYFKKRKPQKSGGAIASTGEFVEITEGGHRFLVNLADYLDVGLALEHRKLRARIQKEAQGKDFLHLYCYTGAAAVYAAAGGAKSTTSVDMGRAYLEWAEKNFRLNSIPAGENRLIRLDAIEFLVETPVRYDLCLVDPPSRSTNRTTGESFDVQKDHVRLLKLVFDKMREGGRVYFSTSSREFRLEESVLSLGKNIRISEVTRDTTPLDFERKPSQRTWLFEL
jgi:23S rRNA (guanine2445-N2)-methyltransferase / 23S rRNA (guanine2069-N7)-methyltransferase